MLAVLPDFERWGNNYVLIAFDGDPTLDQDRLAKLDASTRQRLAGDWIAMHGYMRSLDTFVLMACTNPCRRGACQIICPGWKEWQEGFFYSLYGSQGSQFKQQG